MGCTEEDLNVLDYKDRWTEMRAFETREYLRVEVEYLSKLRRGKQHWEDSNKRKANQDSLIAKRKRLENATNVPLHRVRDDLRPFVFGDYLAKPKGTRITQKTVQARLSAHSRATKIMDTCHTDPMTALDFCLTYPNWGPNEFFDLRERISKVFRLEGARILHKVPKDERKKLIETPLEDVYRAFQDRNSAKLILHYLKQEVGIEVASAIMNHPACQDALSRGGEEEEVAKKLLEFWDEKDDAKKRRQRLEHALKRRKLSIPSHLAKFNAYVTGRVCEDVEHVVAFADFGDRLRKLGTNPWGHYFNRYQVLLNNFMKNDQLSPDEAVTKIMKRIPKNIPNYLKSRENTNADEAS